MVLFNSPKGVGKTEAIKYIRSKGINLISAECKTSLHELTMTLFGVSPDRYWEIYNDRDIKDQQLEEFCITLPYHELCEISDILGRWVTTVPFGNHRKVYFSIREAMIYVSECVVKPRWGEDYFGVERVRRMEKFEHNYSCIDGVNMDFNLVFTDDSCGFEDELPPLFDYVGNENVLLIRIYRDGYTFLGDSRQYVSPDVTTVDIFNNGTEEEYKEEVYNAVKRWLNE